MKRKRHTRLKNNTDLKNFVFNDYLHNTLLWQTQRISTGLSKLWMHPYNVLWNGIHFINGRTQSIPVSISSSWQVFFSFTKKKKVTRRKVDWIRRIGQNMNPFPFPLMISQSGNYVLGVVMKKSNSRCWSLPFVTFLTFFSTWFCIHV